MIKALLGRLPIAARAATLVLNAALAVVVGRIFGATASGEFFVAFAVVNLVGMLGRLGSENLAIKILPALFSSGKHGEFWGQMRWLARVCGWGSGIVAVIVFLCGSGWVAFGLSGNVGLHLMILAVSVPFTSRSILQSSALRSSERISQGAFAETGLSQGLTIVSVVALTSFVEAPPIAVSISYTAASVLTVLVSIYWTRRAVPKPASIPTLARPAGQFRSMLQMMGSSVLFFLLTSGPIYALGIAGSAREVGLFNAAARASVVISLIPSLQSTYLIPRVARSLASGDIDGANAQLKRAVRLGSAFGAVLAVLMLAFSEAIVGVFGTDFEAARPTLIVLVVGQALTLMIGNVNPVMAVAGLERVSLVIAAVTVAVGLPLMLFAAMLEGAVAVAIIFIAASIAYSLSSALILNSRLGVRCFIS